MTRKLREILLNRNIGLYNLLERNEFKIESRIEKLKKDFPQYTDHSYPHYKSIENFLDQFIPEERKDEFLGEEIFILLSSALFHDIGMITETFEVENIEDIRKKHADISAKYVYENKEEFGFNHQLAKIISNICKVHREPQDLLSNIEEMDVYEDLKIRTQFLGALLNLSDAFDIQTQRSIISKIVGDLSSNRWQYNELIMSVYVDSTKWLLLLGTVARFPDEIKIVLELRDFLQKNLAIFSNIFYANGIFYSYVGLDNQFEILSEITSQLSYYRKTVEQSKNDLSEKTITINQINDENLKLRIKLEEFDEKFYLKTETIIELEKIAEVAKSKLEQLNKDLAEKITQLCYFKEENYKLQEKIDSLNEKFSFKTEATIELKKLAEAAKSRSDLYKEDSDRLRDRVSHLEKILIGSFIAIFASFLSLLIKYLFFGK